MSVGFRPKDGLVESRQLKVQRLVIPFKVTASATAANVVLASDESAILFLQSNGVNQITAASSASALQFNTQSPTDSSGQLNMFLKINDKAAKVMNAQIISRTDGTAKACYPDVGGTSVGISSTGDLMIFAATGVNFTTTSLDACLCVEYVVTSGN